MLINNITSGKGTEASVASLRLANTTRRSAVGRHQAVERCHYTRTLSDDKPQPFALFETNLETRSEVSDWSVDAIGALRLIVIGQSEPQTASTFTADDGEV